MSNLVVRTLSGIVFVALIAGGIIAGPVAFGIVFAGLCAMSLWEFATLLNAHAGTDINRLITTVSGAYLFVAFLGYTSGLTSVVVFAPYLLSTLYLLVSELYLGRPTPLQNWAYAFASHIYVALPFALLCTMAFRETPEGGIAFHYIYPLAIFIFLWLNDSGAYVFGSLFSRYLPYKLFERISPKKSWIGSLGGAAVVLAAAAWLSGHFAMLDLVQWLGLGAVVVVFGTWGDLVESLMKRHFGVKDSGSIMPGHGGMLDRLDSFLLASPAAAMYLCALVAF